MAKKGPLGKDLFYNVNYAPIEPRTQVKCLFVICVLPQILALAWHASGIPTQLSGMKICPLDLSFGSFWFCCLFLSFFGQKGFAAFEPASM